jgi:hypothetical protein
MARMDAGLFSLQQCAIIFGNLWATGAARPCAARVCVSLPHTRTCRMPRSSITVRVQAVDTKARRRAGLVSIVSQATRGCADACWRCCTRRARAWAPCGEDPGGPARACGVMCTGRTARLFAASLPLTHVPLGCARHCSARADALPFEGVKPGLQNTHDVKPPFTAQVTASRVLQPDRQRGRPCGGRALAGAHPGPAGGAGGRAGGGGRGGWAGEGGGAGKEKKERSTRGIRTHTPSVEYRVLYFLSYRAGEGGRWERAVTLPSEAAAVVQARRQGGSFLMSEACPGERSYVGRLRARGGGLFQ